MSAELETLNKCTNKLELVLTDRDLLVYLLQEGVVNQRFFDDVDNPRSMLTESQKAAKILKELKRLVELDVQVYHTLLDYLREQRKYASVVTILDEQYVNLEAEKSTKGRNSGKNGSARLQLPVAGVPGLQIFVMVTVAAIPISLGIGVYYHMHTGDYKLHEYAASTSSSLDPPHTGPTPDPTPDPLPPQTPDTPKSASAGDKRCIAEIKSGKELEKVLDQIDTPYDRMCSHLGIETCNQLKYGSGGLTVFKITETYMDQNAPPCWEDIVRHLCRDFKNKRLSRDVAKEYSIPWSQYCD